VVTYTYDAWGNILSTSGSMAGALGTHNPLRYRGYVFDAETGLYYLQSRYYDSEMGRFINADSIVSTGQGLLGNNMFAYCLNNPLSYSDPTGLWGHMESLHSPYIMTYGGTSKSYVPGVDDKYCKSDGMINGQGSFKYADSSMMLGSYADNGCGVIAVYNAMQLLGKPQALGTVEDDLFLCGGFLAGGLLGVKPWAIDDYFASQNISCTGYISATKLSHDVQEGSIIVFMILNNKNTIWKGAHYMAAQYINGQYAVYNLYSNMTDVTMTNVLVDPNGTSGFICGFIVGG